MFSISQLLSPRDSGFIVSDPRGLAELTCEEMAPWTFVLGTACIVAPQLGLPVALTVGALKGASAWRRSRKSRREPSKLLRLDSVVPGVSLEWSGGAPECPP